MKDLQCYLVGGAVRDDLLGRPVKDRDWVVVGATAAELERLGYARVGRDFPVFLHPETHEEYALARTERKRGTGHRGFEVHADPEVTLEEDLARRDLTINAMARDAQGGLVDPYGGLADLRARVLRHVSPAFAEDPLRVLRVARFAAQLPGFEVAPETGALMRTMVAAGELDTLSAERIWQEFVRALAAPEPERFVAVLRQCDGLAGWFAELRTLPHGAMAGGSALARYARLPLSAAAFQALGERLKVPGQYAEAAADRLAWGALLAHWPGAEPATLCAALLALKAQHEDTRLRRLVEILDTVPMTERLLALGRDFASIKLDADTTARGPAYGAALKARREGWLADALAEIQAGAGVR